ncbi:MAG TPA: hypothetical protein VIG77_09835 [Ktedonobacterales bacterium]
MSFVASESSQPASQPPAQPDASRRSPALAERRSWVIPTSGWVGRLIDWANRRPHAPLLLAIALSLLARITLLLRTHAMIDGDEALVGIQAQHILQGARPVYFYGQAYMGSLEAYLAAGVFAIFGSSSWALRAIPIALSIPLVYLTWRLALALLPRDTRGAPLLAGLAALVAAVPPIYDAVAQMRAWGGQIEVYIITLALLLATVEMADRLRACAAPVELARRWLLWGFLAGLGFWINPLISYALVACALWLTPPLLTRIVPGPWRRLVERWPALWSPATGDGAFRLGAALACCALVIGGVIGGLPAWLYAIQNAGANLAVYVTQPSVSPSVSGAAGYGRGFLGFAITVRYFTCAAPRALDGWLPAEGPGWLPLRGLLLLPPLVALVAAAWLLRQRLTSSTLRIGLPALYAGAVTAVYCLTTSAWSETKQCSFDQAGRYAAPLALALPFLLLALFAAPLLWSALRVWRRGPEAALSDAALRRGWNIALAVILVAGMAQGATYLTASPTQTFHSPYYVYTPPARMSPLIDYLKQHDIQAAWCNHWIGNIITFESGGQTVCADYYDQVTRGGIKRPPGTLQQVGAASNPSFILIVTEEHPLLARELDAQGIAYTQTILPAEGVTIITPARYVNPATVEAGLAEDYGMNARR